MPPKPKKMNIYQPAYLNELGGRSNNEDSIIPTSPSNQDRLYLVCDGVGGQAKGEIASAIVCEYFQRYFQENQIEIHKKEFLENGLDEVESHLKTHIEVHPECSEMATTLTLLYLSEKENKALIGWVGDSRVYQIRNGEILFQTKDHSEVQSLIDMGEISEEEAENHPKKNVITRAISGKNTTRIDQKIIDDIQPDDFFLLCSDGILENLNKTKIQQWFTSENNPENIKNEILNNALNKTKDNFSMHLIKIKELDETAGFMEPEKLTSKTKNNLKINYILLLIILLFLALFFFRKPIINAFNNNGKTGLETTEEKIKDTVTPDTSIRFEISVKKRR